MTQEQIDTILKKHQLWLDGKEGGECADFQYAHLQGENFRGTYIQCANFQGAHLQDADFQYAHLQGVNFRYADLQRVFFRGANLRDANFQYANLQYANIQYANFQGANFQGADLDFSCFPLSCGGTKFKADIKLAYQLLAHLCTLEIDDSDWQELKDKIMPYAKKSHRATELGL